MAKRAKDQWVTLVLAAACLQKWRESLLFAVDFRAVTSERGQWGGEDKPTSACMQMGLQNDTDGRALEIRFWESAFLSW